MKVTTILKKKLSTKRTFIVAEISANHGGRISNLLKLIKKSKEIGVDAVKIQTYVADDLTLNVKKKDFLIKKNSPWAKYYNYWNLYNNAKTPNEWLKKIFDYANKNEIIVFSSPFSESSVDLLAEHNCPMYKLASPEINHIPLVKKIAKTKKPIIISTGLANNTDIQLAMRTYKKYSKEKIYLLKCTSEYPSPYKNMNLSDIASMRDRFKVDVGLSDHSLGIEVPIGAVVLGAKIIEKHICLDKKINSVDSFFSLDVNQFHNMIKSIRNIEEAIGTKHSPEHKLNKNKLLGRRSLYFSKNIKKNEIIDKNNIKVVRPSYGLHPKYYEKIIGMKVNNNFKIGDRVKFSCVKKK